jgi:hypothetical protein
VHIVELVGDQQGRNVLAQQCQHARIGWGETACLHHKQDQVHIGHCALHGLVQRLVQCVGVQGLKARRIHKHKLRGPRVCMPVMRWRVVCALREVMLIFWPTSAFSSVDLPTLGLPTMATRPQRWPSAVVPGWAKLGCAFEQTFKHAIQVGLHII